MHCPDQVNNKRRWHQHQDLQQDIWNVDPSILSELSSWGVWLWFCVLFLVEASLPAPGVWRAECHKKKKKAGVIDAVAHDQRCGARRFFTPAQHPPLHTSLIWKPSGRPGWRGRGKPTTANIFTMQGKTEPFKHLQHPSPFLLPVSGLWLKFERCISFIVKVKTWKDTFLFFKGKLFYESATFVLLNNARNIYFPSVMSFLSWHCNPPSVEVNSC